MRHIEEQRGARGGPASPRASREGQLMLLTILVLGATFLAATTIAGLLTTYQIRQSTDFVRSAQAIFAADTGIEWGLYQFFTKNPQGLSDPAFTNGATVVTTCYDNVTDPDVITPLPDCLDPLTTLIRATAVSAGAYRAFELQLGRP